MKGRSGTTLVMAVLLGTIAAPASAAPLPSPEKVVGATCEKPLRVEVSRNVPGGGNGPQHAYDDHFIALEVTPSPLGVSWRLAPGLELCPSSSSRTGFGAKKIRITQPEGTLVAAGEPGAPLVVRITARFVPALQLRDGLGPAKLRTLVAGWARRACTLKASNPKGAAMLARLAERSGARGCRPPKRVRASAAELVRNLTAGLNAADADDGDDVGPVYYGVLAQLTTYAAGGA